MAMLRSEIKTKLAEVIQMAMPSLEIDVDNIREDTDLVTDIGLSSVGILYVVIAIEEFFDIRFDDVGFGDFKTLGNVIDYIESKTK